MEILWGRKIFNIPWNILYVERMKFWAFFDKLSTSNVQNYVNSSSIVFVVEYAKFSTFYEKMCMLNMPNF